jgi:hypothetical protein
LAIIVLSWLASRNGFVLLPEVQPSGMVQTIVQTKERESLVLSPEEAAVYKKRMAIVEKSLGRQLTREEKISTAEIVQREFRNRKP